MCCYEGSTVRNCPQPCRAASVPWLNDQLKTSAKFARIRSFSRSSSTAHCCHLEPITDQRLLGRRGETAAGDRARASPARAGAATPRAGEASLTR